jgi:hypothetical protein
MAIGSMWQFTQDVELRYRVRNPAYAAMCDEVDSSLRHLPPNVRSQAVDANLEPYVELAKEQ